MAQSRNHSGAVKKQVNPQSKTGTKIYRAESFQQSLKTVLKTRFFVENNRYGSKKQGKHKWGLGGK